MSEFLINFGKKIKGYRDFLGISQEKLAELVGVSTNTIAAIENGRTFLKINTLEKICYALKIEPSVLFDFPKNKIKDNNKYLPCIIEAIKVLPLKKQKQILEIIKTFE